jgi:hypothetical protein
MTTPNLLMLLTKPLNSTHVVVMLPFLPLLVPLLRMLLHPSSGAMRTLIGGILSLSLLFSMARWLFSTLVQSIVKCASF